jgi:hypothetical protein
VSIGRPRLNRSQHESEKGGFAASWGGGDGSGTDQVHRRFAAAHLGVFNFSVSPASLSIHRGLRSSRTVLVIFSSRPKRDYTTARLVPTQPQLRRRVQLVRANPDPKLCHPETFLDNPGKLPQILIWVDCSLRGLRF